LFGFPWAGAGASVFRTWPDHLPESLELCVPCLPGRDARVDEAPVSLMAPLVASLAQEMLPWLNLPYALFGHSMGALVSFDLAHELSRIGSPPAHLFVSGQRGPRLAYPGQPIFALPDERFLAEIKARYNNIPQAVLEDRAMMRVLLRRLRADFTLVEDYRYRAERRLVSPITAFGGTEDRRITRELVEAWSAETSGSFKVCMLPGDHFFVNSSRADLISIICAQLEETKRS